MPFAAPVTKATFPAQLPFWLVAMPCSFPACSEDAEPRANRCPGWRGKGCDCRGLGGKTRMDLEAGLHDASGGPQRPPGLPRGRAGAQLHPGRRAARGLPIGVEPGPPRARGAARPPPADPHHPQRRADRGGRAPAPEPRPGLRPDRRALAAIGEFREKPSGTIRITAGEHAAEAVLWPALERLCRTTLTSRSRST
jgi:hypothetical protein